MFLPPKESAHAFMIQKTRLDNGLRIITDSMPRMRSISLGIWVRSGSVDETEQEKGLSSVCEKACNFK